MKHNGILATCLIGLLALGAQSCLKSYVEYFDTSSAERLTTYLSDLDAMLGGEQYGWRMEYYVGNEDGDLGGFNVALKFDAEKGEVTAMSEEDATAVCTSHYVLMTDSGPVLSFDTYNKILHKYGTASSEYYEGRGGDYQFFIVDYDKTAKVVKLKGKRNGKFCTLYPLAEPMESFNAKMYENGRNFHVSTFDGFIGENRVEGEFDINNHQITAYEMEVYGQDESGKPKYDIAKTVSVPYIVTETGIKFYETLVLFDQNIDSFNFNFDLDKSDLKLSDPATGITLQSYIPEDWLPYDFYPGNYTLKYESGSLNITLVPTGDNQTFRIKGMSRQFDLMARYDVRTGRIGLRYQIALVPDTDNAIVVDDRYVVVLLPWALEDGGSLWMNPDLGVDAQLRVTRNPETGEVDMEQSLAKPVFTWIDNGAARSFHTDSFILYLYDTDESADDPYGGEANDYSFTGGNSQLANLSTLTKK